MKYDWLTPNGWINDLTRQEFRKAHGNIIVLAWIRSNCMYLHFNCPS